PHPLIRRSSILTARAPSGSLVLTLFKTSGEVHHVPHTACAHRRRPGVVDHLLLHVVRRRTDQTPPRLRELRSRRPSTEAGADRRRPRPRHPPGPSRSRGGHHRRSHRRHHPLHRCRPVHLRGERHLVLLRRTRQGVGPRPWRRALGGVCGQRRRRRNGVLPCTGREPSRNL